MNETEEDASGDSPVVDNISQESSRPRSHNLDQRYNREPFPERSSSAAPSEDSNAQNAAGGGSRARPSQENPSDYPPLPGQAGSSDASSSPHRRRQPHTESSRTKRSSHGSGGSQIEDRMDDLEISATNGPEQLETLIRHVIDLQEQTSVIGEDVSEIQEVVAHGRNKAREQRKYQKAGFKAVRGDLEGGVSKILRQQVTLTKNVNQLEKYIHQVYEILHQQRLALLDVNLQMADEIHQMKCAFLDTKPSLAYKEDERESLKSQIQAQVCILAFVISVLETEYGTNPHHQFGVINKTRARVSSIHHEGTWDEESSGFSEVESERGENRGGEGSSGTPRRPRFRDV